MTRPCSQCHQVAAQYDAWEDCYLCLHCGAVLYPCDYGETDHPDAGIWQRPEEPDGVSRA